MTGRTDYIAPLLEAVSDQEAGRLDAAAAGYEAVLALEPAQPQALLFAGVLAHRQRRFAQAVTLLERAAAARPADAETWLALGNARWSAGDRDGACAAWRCTLEHARRHVGAMLNLARAQELAGDADDAVMTCRAAVACQPGAAAPRAALASALRAAHRPAEALAAAEAAVELDPGCAPAHFQRGTALKALGQLEGARGALEEALRLDGEDASAHLNLANTLADLGEGEAAERHCRRALALDPAMAEAHAVLGVLHTEAGRLPEAAAACRAALALAPDFAEAHFNLSIASLLAGDLQAGFAEYEWRKRHPAFANDFRTLPGPEWRGEALAGKHILVLGEQGLGDAIMLCRYAQVLARRGATVWIACDRRLIPLLSRAPGVAAAVPNRTQLPRLDFWVDQMSLPFLCGTTLDSVPSRSAYLTADPPLVRDWSSFAGPRDGRRRVGLAWAGNKLHPNDRNRSYPADAFRLLAARPDVHAVSLQVGDAAAADAAALGLRDWSPLLVDFGQTAALVAQLDLVVTVDTSVAHLAAALGKPTWILLPHCPDWRWLADRDDSPWYDCVRLFRQARPGDWTGSLDRVLAALDLSARPAGDAPAAPAARPR